MPENIRSLVSCAFSEYGAFEMEGVVAVAVVAWSVVVLLLRYGVYGFPFSYFNGSSAPPNYISKIEIFSKRN